MIVRIETDARMPEDEIVIRCREIDNNVKRLHTVMTEHTKTLELVFYNGNTQYYPDINSILFFETQDGQVRAHTKDETYSVKKTLYYLEGILPSNFMRVSKSAILNVSRIYSIERSLTSSSCIGFWGTHKKMYVSRSYYKAMLARLNIYRNENKEE